MNRKCSNMGFDDMYDVYCTAGARQGSSTDLHAEYLTTEYKFETSLLDTPYYFICQFRNCYSCYANKNRGKMLREKKSQFK